jgi:hypothetical protein
LLTGQYPEQHETILHPHNLFPSYPPHLILTIYPWPHKWHPSFMFSNQNVFLLPNSGSVVDLYLILNKAFIDLKKWTWLSRLGCHTAQHTYLVSQANMHNSFWNSIMNFFKLTVYLLNYHILLNLLSS